VLQLYAEMVAEDRRLGLAGYEIYRFGGWELISPGGEQVLMMRISEFGQGYSSPHAVRRSTAWARFSYKRQPDM
jgi:hypothetical protein